MKILLVAINAKYIHSNLAVYSLKAYANEYADNIHINEYTINNEKDDILKGIYKEQADVVAFSCYIWNYDIVTWLANELKKIQPKAKIWFGGPEVSYNSEQCLNTYEAVDGVVIGEGEQTFLELARYYIGQETDLRNIDGIAYKNTAKRKMDPSGLSSINVTRNRMPISLSAIPFPYKDLEVFEHKIIYYESSRGCPFSCSYCLSSIDRRVRLRNTDQVKKELKFFIDQKIPQVKFVDRTFNCNKDHAMAIWSFLKENDNGITNFHFEIAADILSEEEMDLLSTLRPGLVQFEIGVQSTNQATLNAIRRTTDFDTLKGYVKRIQEGNNIHQHLDLIAGLPYEDFESFCQSFNDVYALRPDQFQLGFLKVLKGSFIEREVEEYGIRHTSTPPYEVLWTKWINYGELLKLKGACDLVEIYYNSGQFTYSIQFIEHYFKTPVEFYLKFHEFYEEKQYDQVSHARIRKYEIFLEFFQEKVLANNEEGEDCLLLFCELLVLDLCLRENIKSRPNFANPPVDYKSTRKIFDVIGLDKKRNRIEAFHHDLMGSAQSGTPIQQENMIVFDYENRDPLNKSAQIHVIGKTGKGDYLDHTENYQERT